MLFSLLMPYWKRADQLNNTLASFAHHYKNGAGDYEVILIEDKKNRESKQEHLAMWAVVERWGHAVPIKVVPSYHDCFNPAPLYNTAAECARGKYLIITNPECMHKVNILKALVGEFAKNSSAYVICGCQNWRVDTPRIDYFLDFRGSFIRWFQHSSKWNTLYHWCSAMSKETYAEVGGFDDEFGAGYAFEDADFRDRTIDAGVPFILRDDLLVYHQRHEKVRPKEYAKLHKRNQMLWMSKNPQWADRQIKRRFFDDG